MDEINTDICAQSLRAFILIPRRLRSGSAAGGGGEGGSRGAGGGSRGGIRGGEGQAESVWEYARRAAGQGRE